MTWENIDFLAKQEPKGRVTQKWFKDNKVKVLKWPNQNQNLNPTENLCLDLKSAANTNQQAARQKLSCFVRNGGNEFNSISHNVYPL